MTDDLIAELSADLKPVPSGTLERRIVIAAGLGLVLACIGGAWLFTQMGRPFGATWGSDMFWMKFGYTLAFGLLGLAATPILARPDGRIVWPLVATAGLFFLALAIGSWGWMQADWAMPVLMGGTAMVCPWLITLTGVPILAALLVALRPSAPRRPTLAGFAAGLVAGGLGAWAYAFYCGETSMLFMAVWYSLGMAITALLGAALGRYLLRW